VNKKKTLFFIAFWTVASISYSDDLNSYLSKGNAAYATRNYTEAKQDYLNAISQNPVDAKAYYGLGATEFMLQEIEAAKEHFNRALDLAPDFQGAQIFLENILTALPLAEKQKAFPDVMKRGFEYFQGRDYLRANSLFRQAVAINSDSAKAHYYLGLSLAKLGSYNAATGELEKCLKLDPQNMDARLNLDQIVSGKGVLVSTADSFYIGSLSPPKITEKLSPMGTFATPDLESKTASSTLRWVLQTSGSLNNGDSGGQPIQDPGWTQSATGGLLFNSSIFSKPCYVGYFLGGILPESQSTESARFQHRLSLGISTFQEKDLAGSVAFDKILVHDESAIEVQKEQGSFSLVGPNLPFGTMQSSVSVQSAYYSQDLDYNGYVYSGSVGIVHSISKEQVINFNVSGGLNETDNVVLVNQFGGLSVGYSWGGGNHPGVSASYSFQIQEYPNSFLSNGEMRHDYLNSAGLVVYVPVAAHLNASAGCQFSRIDSNYSYYAQTTNGIFWNLNFPF
jgi:tetratricopeptide (TPR) repeat protein